jgi:hypothetical protein
MLMLRRHKNDEADALHLAVVGQVGAVHEAYLPTPYEENLRSLTRKRYDLNDRRTSLARQAHAVMARNLAESPTVRPTTKSARKKWLEADLPPVERLVLSSTIREMDSLKKNSRNLH